MMEEKKMENKEKLRYEKNRTFSKSFFIYFTLFFVSSSLYYFSKINMIDVDNKVIIVISKLMYIAVVLLFTKILLRTTVNKIYRLFEEVEIEGRIFLAKVYQVLIYILSISIILYILGVSMSNIMIFLGLIGTGVAIALKDILVSIFVWVIILTKRPFRIGDVVDFSDDIGVVERIGTFFVTVRVEKMGEEMFVKVPNTIILNKNLKNYGNSRLHDSIRFKFKKHPKNTERLLDEVSALLKKEKIKKFDINLESTDGSLVMVVNIIDDYKTISKTKNKIILKVYSKYNGYFVVGK